MQKSYLGLRSNRRARSEDKDRAGPALDGRLADGGEAADGGGGGGQVQSKEDPGEWALIPVLVLLLVRMLLLHLRLIQGCEWTGTPS